MALERLIVLKSMKQTHSFSTESLFSWKNLAPLLLISPLVMCLSVVNLTDLFRADSLFMVVAACLSKGLWLGLRRQ